MRIQTQSNHGQRRYQPQRLYQLAFNDTCHGLWDLSRLPSLHAEAAQNYKENGSDENNEDYKEYLQNSSTTLENIEKSLQCSGKVPYHLRMKIMCVVSEIDNDMRDFAFAVARGLAHKTTDNIKYCMEHVVFSEDFTINMIDSLCNILQMSEFQITFTKEFLASYCVKKSKVLEVFEELCNDLERRLKKKNIKKGSLAARNLAIKILQMQQHTEGLMTGKAYWKKQNHQNRKEYYSKNLRYATDFQYVAVVGSIDALKYHCDITCQRLDDYEIPQHVFQCAKYMFEVGNFSAEKIMFFYKNLNSEMRKRLLADEFVNIFMTFIKSWRYRHLCITMFNEVKETVEATTIQSILEEIASMENNRYQYYEMITIVKDIWNEIPDSCKADRKISNAIPELILQGKDTDHLLQSLAHFLKDYPTEMQNEIISYIIFKLVSSSKENHTEACINIAQELGLKPIKAKEYLTRDRLKTLLVHDASTSTKTDYDRVSKYFTNNEEEENALKEELLQDKHFIVDFLVNSNDSLLPFLGWALKKESRINTFKIKIIRDNLIEDIYQRRLQSKSICDADFIFNEAMLNLNEQQITQIKNKIKGNANVVNAALLNTLKSGCNNLETFFATLSLTKEEEIQLMCEFIHSPVTKEAIYDMILDLENFDLSFLYANEGARVMLKWHKFITNMLKPYTDIVAYEAMLLEDRDTIVSACHEKVKRHPKLTSRFNDQTIKMNIDLRLRCFSRLVHEDLGSKLQEYLKFPVEQSGPFMFRFAMNIYHL